MTKFVVNDETMRGPSVIAAGLLNGLAENSSKNKTIRQAIFLELILIDQIGLETVDCTL